MRVSTDDFADKMLGRVEELRKSISGSNSIQQQPPIKPMDPINVPDKSE
ncbi:MAG: hypothetical protein MSH49_05320 [[Eubacterium] saphenum]|nr:hypothetical protein [[Eubacterium] saphenum]